LAFWWGFQFWPGVKAGSPGVHSGTTLALASLPGVDPVSPVCALDIPVLAWFHQAVRRTVRHRGRWRRLCTGWAQDLCFKWLFLPPDYKYPFTYLGEDKVAIQIISLPSLSLSSIKEHSKLEDLPFYPLKSKSLW
jgi:hypothetical protein